MEFMEICWSCLHVDNSYKGWTARYL